MIAFTINQFISAYRDMINKINQHKLKTTNDIDKYINKHKSSFQNILQLTPNSRPFEIMDFYHLCINLKPILHRYDVHHYDISGFFLNTKLGNGMLTDFDVLRFSNTNILNIELKHNIKKDFTTQKGKLINKFKTQNHILKIIAKQDKIHNNTEKNIYNIVYFSESNKLMMFNSQNSSLEQINMNSLCNILINGKTSDKNELRKLQPSDYIISPSKDFQQFIHGEYLLTSHQQHVVNIILHKNGGLYGIYGCAGSGKSLLAYDMIKTLSRQNNHILFIFCGHKEHIHDEMNNYFNNQATFIQINQLWKDDINLNTYNYIFIDEAQKIYPQSFDKIKNIFNNISKGITVCFLYDLQQSLENGDMCEELNAYLHKNATCFKLGGKHNRSIRSNKIINAFIKAVMDKSQDISEIDINKLYKYIDIKYFDSAKDATPYIFHLESHGYNFLVPTPDPNNNNSCSVDKFLYPNTLKIDDSNNAHSNIGTEHDKVVTYADENLNYIPNSNKIHQINTEYYKLDNELYVNMSRAVSRLTLLIINNKSLYLSILHTIYRNRDMNHKVLYWYHRLPGNYKRKLNKRIIKENKKSHNHK